MPWLEDAGNIVEESVEAMCNHKKPQKPQKTTKTHKNHKKNHTKQKIFFNASVILDQRKLEN